MEAGDIFALSIFGIFAVGMLTHLALAEKFRNWRLKRNGDRERAANQAARWQVYVMPETDPKTFETIRWEIGVERRLSPDRRIEHRVLAKVKIEDIQELADKKAAAEVMATELNIHDTRLGGTS